MAVVTMALLLAVPTSVHGQHTHDFSTSPAINSQPVMITPFVALPLEIVTVGGYTTEDFDTCQNPGCCFQEGLAPTPLKVTAWSDGNAGGAFGKIVNGQFTATPNNPEQVTHYRCPSNTCTVSITQTLDEDTLQALVPGSDPPAYVTTANDNPVTTDAWELVVWNITAPCENPLAKYVMSSDVPSESVVDLLADRAAYWSALLGWQFEEEWSEDEEPVSSRTLTITTDGNRGGGANDGKLPDSYLSFGHQHVYAFEEAWESEAEREFLLFFPKDGTNNPNGNVPNWYYYWSQTSANYGTHSYDASLGSSGSGITRYVSGAWRAYIGPAAALGPLGVDPWIWDEAQGIDAFANVCRHEAQHVALYSSSAWWPSGYNANLDSDGDMIPNYEELGLTSFHEGGYLLGDPTTYDDHFNYGTNWSDDEDYTLHSQTQWQNSDANDEDWSAGTKSKQY
ncbi:MAG: hypothetical protein HY321_07560 [Armatimonadetes bacterium]|nr:hypothetical protein [Armatimonadota bacterium]